jgi:hypothetical protein
VSDDERIVRIDQTNASEKHMLTALWFIEGLPVIEWFGSGDKIIIIYFCDIINDKIV